jgi:hypothetical protein
MGVRPKSASAECSNFNQMADERVLPNPVRGGFSPSPITMDFNSPPLGKRFDRRELAKDQQSNKPRFTRTTHLEMKGIIVNLLI